jgi:hypothetical protein
LSITQHVKPCDLALCRFFNSSEFIPFGMNPKLKFCDAIKNRYWRHGAFNFGYAQAKSFPPATLIISTLRIFKEQQLKKLQTKGPESNLIQSIGFATDAFRVKALFSLYSKSWWRMTGSNRRPPACKAGALPAELIPRLEVGGSGWIRTNDPRLIKTVL